MGRGRPSLEYPSSEVCGGIEVKLGYNEAAGEVITEVYQAILGGAKISGSAQVELHHGSGLKLVVRSNACAEKHTEIDEKLGYHYLEDISLLPRPCKHCKKYDFQIFRPTILKRIRESIDKPKKAPSARTVRRNEKEEREAKLADIRAALSEFNLSDFHTELYEALFQII